MSVLLFLLFAAIAIMTGCKYTAAPAELLQKPTISADKERLLAAIEKALPRYSKLILPYRENVKEAIRLLDVNGDGMDEAVVTYFNEYSSPEIMVLRQTEFGWKQAVRIEQPLAKEIEWLKLVDLNRDGTLELIAGWIGAFNSPDVLELYSFQSKPLRNEKGVLLLKPLYTIPYTLAEAGDLDGDGIEELVVIHALGTSGELELSSYFLSVYNWSNNGFSKLLTHSLPQGAYSFQRMLIGKVSERNNGLLLEGNTGNHGMLTYMYTWEDGNLTLVYPKAIHDQDGFSGKSVVSRDRNGDGIIELLWAREAPGTEQLPYAEMIWVHDWMQWNGKDGYHQIAEQITNDSYGLILDIPEAWRGSYSVRKPPPFSYGILSFDYWNKNRGTTAELATLYVVPIKKWGTVEAAWKENRRHYQLLTKESGNVYLVSFATPMLEHLSNEEKMKYLEMAKEVSRLLSYITIEHNN